MANLRNFYVISRFQKSLPRFELRWYSQCRYRVRNGTPMGFTRAPLMPAAYRFLKPSTTQRTAKRIPITATYIAGGPPRAIIQPVEFSFVKPPDAIATNATQVIAPTTTPAIDKRRIPSERQRNGFMPSGKLPGCRAISALTCRRRPNFDHLCRLNFDQGTEAVL